MTEGKKQPQLVADQGQPAPTADDLLRTLVTIRMERKKKFVPYSEDRELKRAEKIAWEQAEELYFPRPKKQDPVDRAVAAKKTAKR